MIKKLKLVVFESEWGWTMMHVLYEITIVHGGSSENVCSKQILTVWQVGGPYGQRAGLQIKQFVFKPWLGSLCFVLGKGMHELNPHSAHLHTGVEMDTDKLLGQPDRMLGSNLPNCFMLQKLELSAKSYEPDAMKLTRLCFLLVKQNCVL